MEILREGSNKRVKRKMERNRRNGGKEESQKKRRKKDKRSRKKKRMKEEMSQNVEFNCRIFVNRLKLVAFNWEVN
jgi:hypothetical protein